MCEQVLSWQVTDTMLAAWGFPVERTDKVVGSKFVVQAGLPFGKALHAAWAAGFVRMAAIPEAVVTARIEAFHAGLLEMRQEANKNLAFLRAHGTIVGPSHNN
jgi:hypothetical protein